jgi:methyl-accepting chemotaxis protein
MAFGWPKKIDVFVHHVDSDRKLDAILEGVNQIMGRVEELNAELVEINATTNELAADVDDLVAKLAAGGLTDAEAAAAIDQLKALKGRLQSIAATHTTDAPPVN